MVIKKGMTDNNNPFNHLMRISNCLETILDLEPQLRKLDLGKSIIKEFVVLKSFLEQLEFVDVREEDVERIEKATKCFLDELRGPLAIAENFPDLRQRMQ